jgi:hypothetical protein
MQVHVFRGQGRVFAATRMSGGENLPARYGPWVAFKTLDLVEGQAQPGLDVAECLDDIERFGLHVTDAHVRITEEALR